MGVFSFGAGKKLKSHVEPSPRLYPLVTIKTPSQSPFPALSRTPKPLWELKEKKTNNSKKIKLDPGNKETAKKEENSRKIYLLLLNSKKI